MEEVKVSSSLLIVNIGLSARTLRVLKWHKIDTVDKVCSYIEKQLLGMGKIGPVTLKEIKDALAKHGLSLAT